MKSSEFLHSGLTTDNTNILYYSYMNMHLYMKYNVFQKLGEESRTLINLLKI